MDLLFLSSGDDTCHTGWMCFDLGVRNVDRSRSVDPEICLVVFCHYALCNGSPLAPVAHPPHCCLPGINAIDGIPLHSVTAYKIMDTVM